MYSYVPAIGIQLIDKKTGEEISQCDFISRDVVDIYAVDPATETLVLMAENVYVDEVYDNSGNRITDDEGVATSFTVWVTPEEVESINTAVVYGGIQMYLKTE